MPSQNSNGLKLLLLAACACPLALVGCMDKTVKAAAPVQTAPAPTIAESKPITNIAPDTTALPPVEAAPPPVSVTPTASASLPVTPARTKPAPPPKKPAVEPAAEVASEQPSKPAAPVILPQLSAGDQETYKRQVQEDTDVAQSNLQRASGKVLSAAQTDLVQKIQNFLKDSRAASQEGDWTRAQQLSQKARRVSVELVESF